MTMVERVARAMYEADPSTSTGQAFDHPAIHREYTRIARAAIAAMREPTPAMLEAVKPFPEWLRQQHPDSADSWHPWMEAATLADQLTLRSEWKAMIDAALAEEV